MGTKWLGSMIISCLVCQGTAKPFSKAAVCTILNSRYQCMSLVISLLCKAGYYLFLKNITILVNTKYVLL